MRLIVPTLLALLTTGCTILRPTDWPRGSGEIILTFDDGPNAEISPALLDVLARHEVKAVFCYVGDNMAEQPGIVRRAHAEGHEIALHGYSHRPGSLFQCDGFLAELEQARALLREILGDPDFAPRLLRPPYGLRTPATRKAARTLGLDEAYVTFFVYDASAGPEKASTIMRQIRHRLEKHAGGAIVLHERRYRPWEKADKIDRSWLPEAVDALIVWAKAEGFRFTLYPAKSTAS